MLEQRGSGKVHGLAKQSGRNPMSFLLPTKVTKCYKMLQLTYSGRIALLAEGVWGDSPTPKKIGVMPLVEVRF